MEIKLTFLCYILFVSKLVQGKKHFNTNSHFLGTVTTVNYYWDAPKYFPERTMTTINSPDFVNQGNNFTKLVLTIQSMEPYN